MYAHHVAVLERQVCEQVDLRVRLQAAVAPALDVGGGELQRNAASFL
jgi:hypothetical protein